MDFAPLTDLNRAPLSEKVQRMPTKELALKYRSKNRRYGNYISYGVALIAAIGFGIVWVLVLRWAGVISNRAQVIFNLLLAGIAVFYVTSWQLLQRLWPGD